jgi:hypothetical protein
MAAVAYQLAQRSELPAPELGNASQLGEPERTIAAKEIGAVLGERLHGGRAVRSPGRA